ncbi:MAG: hypothetical protein ACR2FG_04610 [Marmoricola sp.]
MTARAPEMWATWGAGLGIADSRSLRVRVDDEGALTVTRPGEPPKVVTSAARVTRAVWLPAEESRQLLGSWSSAHVFAKLSGSVLGRMDRGLMRRKLGPELDEMPGSGLLDPDSMSGAVVIFDSEGPVLSFYVEHFTPWSGDLPTRRELSGAVAVVRALGLVLERRSDSDVLDRRAVRAVRVERTQGSGVWLMGSVLLSVAGIVLAFLSWPYGGTTTGALASAGALLVTAPVVGYLVRSRLRFLSLVTVPPDPGSRVVYRPTGLAPNGDGPHLQLGSDDVVVVTGGQEYWLPGPALGGVQRLEIGYPDVHLTDAQGRVLHVLVAQEAAPRAERERLEQICTSAGIELRVSGDDNATQNLQVRLSYDKDWPPGLMISDWEQGRISLVTDTLVLLAVLLLVPGAIAAAVTFPPWGYLILAGSLVGLGARIWTSLSYWRWQRRVVRQSKEA